MLVVALRSLVEIALLATKRADAGRRYSTLLSRLHELIRNPLMNQERMRAMVLSIAAHGGAGTVGFWSDC